MDRRGIVTRKESLQKLNLDELSYGKRNTFSVNTEMTYWVSKETTRAHHAPGAGCTANEFGVFVRPHVAVCERPNRQERQEKPCQFKLGIWISRWEAH